MKVVNALGRRKSAVARVYLVAGKGNITINGRYVGFSKNSRNLAQFDITPYLKEGENVLAVEVYRNSDASFLESQDMFRLPGIYRDVYLTAKPKVQVRDIVCIPFVLESISQLMGYMAEMT